MGAPAPKPTPSPRPTPTPSPTPTPKPTPSPSPTPGGQTGVAVTDISNIALKSSCNNYNWQGRGRAPSGYVSGIAVTFAKSLCRLRAGENKALLMAQKDTGNTSVDAIAWFEAQFDAQKLGIGVSGPETLRSLYTLGMGLGMKESSGNYCEGYDTSAGPETADEAEAGLFQTSYNSIGASSELRKIYNEYLADQSKCYLSVFQKGASCRSQGIVGSGAGADFQRFQKSCPAFAAEYAMIMLRVLRKHYGPINRHEAEVIPSCDQMFDAVESYVESRPTSVCPGL